MAEIGAYILNHLLPLIIIVIGFGLLVVEMYIPGFGVCGISGTVLMVVGVILIAEGEILIGLIAGVVIVALLCIAFSIAIRSASKGRIAKSKLVLNQVSTDGTKENDMDYYIGKKGVTNTVLRPSGIGDFDGVRLNIVSDGDFIGANERVEVRRVEGNRIFVTKA